MPILVHLDPELVAFASELGGGNKTLGVRRALSHCQTVFAPGIANAPPSLLSHKLEAHATDYGNLVDAMSLTRRVFSISLAARAEGDVEGWVAQRAVAKRLQWSQSKYSQAQLDAVNAKMVEVRAQSADGATPAMVRPCGLAGHTA